MIDMINTLPLQGENEMDSNKEQELAAIRKNLKEMIVRDLSLEDINPADMMPWRSSCCCSAISAWK